LHFAVFASARNATTTKSGKLQNKASQRILDNVNTIGNNVKNIFGHENLYGILPQNMERPACVAHTHSEFGGIRTVQSTVSTTI
jgi:hypothetical protein